MIVELNERPWATSPLPRAISRHLSLLDGISGAVAISGELTEWAANESRRIGRSVRILEIPIVVDVDEQMPMEYWSWWRSSRLRGVSRLRRRRAGVHPRRDAPRVAATPRLQASRDRSGPCGSRCWRRTDGHQSSTLDERVVPVGYVARDELLELYAQSRALLIPLFADDQSRARFPSKIGEYLAAARPVVTTHVGEIDRFLTDGVTAYVSAPGDPAAYGESIEEHSRRPCGGGGCGKGRQAPRRGALPLLPARREPAWLHRVPRQSVTTRRRGQCSSPD